MNFDYTYIVLFGFQIFEPMVLVTNSIFFILSLLFFNRLSAFHTPYAQQMRWFMLLLGISAIVGAIGHAVHLQLGEPLFKLIVFLMNASSLLAIYFCFRGSYTYIDPGRTPAKKYIYLVLAWVLALLVESAINGNFTVIKVHAALVLLFALIVHTTVYYRRHENGSRQVVLGLLVSFLPIIVHSLKFSISEWFNYKDIAHVIMIISLIIIYRGVALISEHLPETKELHGTAHS